MVRLSKSRSPRTLHLRPAPEPAAPSLGGPHFRLGDGQFPATSAEPAPASRYPAPRQAQFPSLIAWRGLACLLVVVLHSSFYCFTTNQALEPSAQSQLLPLTERFWIGVPLFFVISGYCIASTVDSHRRRGDRGASYFVRRIKRIAPPYWCALAVTVAAVLLAERWLRPGLFADQTSGFPDPAALNAHQWLGNIALCESWRYLVVGSHPSYFLGNAWTLFYEEQFYVVAGLLLIFAPRRFFAAAFGVTLLTLAARHFGPGAGLQLQGSFLDGHWLMFAAGIAVYHVQNHANAWQKWASVAMLVAGIAYVCQDLALVRGLPNNFESNALSAFCFALVLIGVRRWDAVIMNARLLAPIRFCGTICYSLYLVHWPICKATSHLLSDAGFNSPSSAALIVLPCCMGASVAAGYGFHVLVERRFLNTPMSKA